MSRSWAALWCRALAFTLLGLTGMGVGARPVRAAGCHAVERPTLGMAFSWERAAVPDLRPAVHTPPPPTVATLPCSGDLPGRPSRIASRPSFVPITPSVPEPPAHADLLRPVPCGPPPLRLSARLDRPPRPHAG